MRSIVAQSLAWGACLVAGLMARTNPAVAANCALYARAETGVMLYGSAGGWWDEAEGRYERGPVPAVGAILVFKRTRRIPSGHVAVVAKVVSASEILVDHANWYRGRVSRGMSVIDTSPGHDWTSVAVIDLPSGKYGSDYPAYGFVYPGPGPREIIEARAGRGLDSYVADGQRFGDLSAQPALLRLAVATETLPGGVHATTTMRRNHHGTRPTHPVHKASTGHAHNHAVAHAKPASSPASHAVARSPTRTVKTTAAKHHRA